MSDDAGAGTNRCRLAAGGRVVNDANATEWWTLEDPAGNQADIASG